MILAAVTRILVEDLAKISELPKWVSQFVLTINQNNEQFSRALQNRLTFEDNVQSVVKTLSFSSGIETEASTGSNLRVSGIIPTDANGKIITGFGFARKTNGNIGITLTFSGGGSATCSVIILLK